MLFGARDVRGTGRLSRAGGGKWIQARRVRGRLIRKEEGLVAGRDAVRVEKGSRHESGLQSVGQGVLENDAATASAASSEGYG